MNEVKLTKGSIVLGPSGVVTFINGKGLVVHCQTGLLWVTVEKDADDYWLKSGQSMEIKLTGRAVIQAMEQASELRIVSPQPNSPLAIRVEVFG